MTTPLSSISGLMSGFNYADLVDAIIAQARMPAARMEAERAALESKATAIGVYRGHLETLRTAATALSNGTAFDAISATTSVFSGSRALATASATPGAAAGSFLLEVQQMAKAEKLTTTAQDATTPLGQTGSFTINGRIVTLTASDTLSTLRDRINAANTGATPSGVTASILTVAPGDQRLILTSSATGAAGMTLADTDGTILQDLGLLDAGGAKLASATIVAGSDALFTIDGFAMTRSSNQITDVIDGVSLTLTGEEAGAVTRIDVGRYAEAAQGAMQRFVDAYNGLVDFLKQQGTVGATRPPLYGESMLRATRSALPQLLLQTVGGAAADLATVASAGVSLTRDGRLTFDSATFTTAFNTRYDDLRSLFSEQRSATGAGLTFVSSGAHATSGTHQVEITAVATRASILSTGFSGVYDDGGTADLVTITDTLTGRSATVTLVTGMDSQAIEQAIQSAFQADGVNLTVSRDGDDIRLSHGAYGSSAGISVTVQGTGDGANELWATDQSATGTDVSGTIGGALATGSGQTLVGSSGAVAGLTVSYTGDTTGAVGTITLGVGAGSRVVRLLDDYLQSGNGLVAEKLAGMDRRVDALTNRITALDARLEQRRAVLLQTFFQMESSIARLRQQSSSLTRFSTTSSAS